MDITTPTSKGDRFKKSIFSLGQCYIIINYSQNYIIIIIINYCLISQNYIIIMINYCLISNN